MTVCLFSIQLLESPIPLSSSSSVCHEKAVATLFIHQGPLSGWWSEFSLGLINLDDDDDDFDYI